MIVVLFYADLQVQLPKQTPRSLNGSVTSLSSAELTLGGSPRPVRSGELIY